MTANSDEVKYNLDYGEIPERFHLLAKTVEYHHACMQSAIADSTLTTFNRWKATLALSKMKGTLGEVFMDRTPGTASTGPDAAGSPPPEGANVLTFAILASCHRMRGRSALKRALVRIKGELSRVGDTKKW